MFGTWLEIWLGLRPGCALDFRDVDLRHSHHGFHGFGILDQLDHAGGHNLPCEAELVPEPTALHFLSAGRKLRPILVHLLLAVAANHERDGLIELERGAAVQRRKTLAVEFRSDGEYASLWSARNLHTSPQLIKNARVFE